MKQIIDIAVVGAGPCGLGVGVAARQRGVSCTLFDKGCLTRSLTLYPQQMRFFSTPERLELGGLPFITIEDKPTRREALKYYRRVAEHFELDVRQYTAVESVRRTGDGFELDTRLRTGEEAVHAARNVVIATGYFDTPNLLRIPGEELPNVFHYFQEADPFYGQRCVVVGAGNSAVDAALELYRAGAEVSLVHFADRLDPGVKPWVLPDIENRLKAGDITARWRTRLTGIGLDHVTLWSEETGETERLPNEWVFAMTGYRPDPVLLRSLGVEIDDATGIPVHDPTTMETDVPGVFIAGVIVAGYDANKIFIENGRHHGPRIVEAVRSGRQLSEATR